MNPTFIENISTDTSYFFTNKKKREYKVLLVKKQAVKDIEKFTLTVIPDVPFQVSPLEFENIEPLILANKASAEELYISLEQFIENSFSSGYSNIYLGTDEYYDEEQHYISDITAGVPYRDYQADSAKVFHVVKTSNTTSLRYDVYDTAIKVSKDKVENNTFIYEDFYTLWYPNLGETEKAIQSILHAKEVTSYSFDEFSKIVEKIDNHERIYTYPEHIIFDHLIKPETYLSEKLSGLLLPIPNSEFKGFDPINLEEGRIYFWINKNEKSILDSELQYFVLQNRRLGGYVIGESSLEEFNASYWQKNYLSTDSMLDEIQCLLERVSEGFIEISQEKIIEILTGLKASDVLTQKIKKTIYLDAHAYDIYDNMVQHWAEGSNKNDYKSATFFFSEKEACNALIKKEISEQKNNGLDISNHQNSALLLEHYRSIEETNFKYNQQKPIKEELLIRYPHVKDQLSDYNHNTFMKYSPLKVIEGDYSVSSSTLINADETSLFIKGDLIINGTLMIEPIELFQNNHFLIVAGNVRVDNFVQNPRFRFMLFAQNFSVQNVMYLPAASRSWFINIAGKLEADKFIHSKDKKIIGADNNMIFNHEFSTTNKKIFVDGFFNDKSRDDKLFIYNHLKAGKNLFQDNLNQDEIDNNLLLTSFKRNLRNWYQLYYEFAGFELQELGTGEHYGCYIESDQIVKDIRQDTGMYLMSHDDLSLELVDAAKPIKEKSLSSKDLAYRFFWIMWTFSSWKHRQDGPMDYWQNQESINTRYNNGKSYFKNDSHLALYWIMHFGLLEDDRYGEMKRLMANSEHPLIQGALLFFTELKVNKSFSIEVDGKQNTELFRSRILRHKKLLKLT